MKTRERQPEAAGNVWLEMACAAIKGGVLAGVFAVFLLFLAACLISNGIIREEWLEISVLFSCMCGAMAGGTFAVRGVKPRKAALGVGAGIVLFLLLAVSGILVYGMLNEKSCLKIFCSCVVGGGLAGMAGRKGKKKHRR